MGSRHPYKYRWSVGALDPESNSKEWQIQTLAAATNDTNYEGDTTDAEALTPTTRPFNTCQIQKKVFNISGTEEEVKKGGKMQSEIDRQTALKMSEHAKNMEYGGLTAVMNTSEPRQQQGILNWITTNIGMADDAVLNSDGTITPGTARPLSEDLIKAQLQNAFTQGGNVEVFYGSPFQKQQISNFVNTGNTRRFVEEKKLINSVDVYESDFNMIAVKPHRNMPTSVLLGLDSKYWKKAILRPTFREQLAKSGDAWPYHVITEWCWEACAEPSSFRITDLTTS